jgi:hypothetical protein
MDFPESDEEVEKIALQPLQTQYAQEAKLDNW